MIQDVSFPFLHLVMLASFLFFSMFNMLTPSLANQALCGWSYWSEHYKNFNILISLLGC